MLERNFWPFIESRFTSILCSCPLHFEMYNFFSQNHYFSCLKPTLKKEARVHLKKLIFFSLFWESWCKCNAVNVAQNGNMDFYLFNSFLEMQRAVFGVQILAMLAENVIMKSWWEIEYENLWKKPNSWIILWHSKGQKPPFFREISIRREPPPSTNPRKTIAGNGFFLLDRYCLRHRSINCDPFQ